jgi:hypothetical protein
VAAVHAVEDRRSMNPPEDMELIRARFVQLEQKRITTEIGDQLLAEYDFEIVSQLTGAAGSPPTG